MYNLNDHSKSFIITTPANKQAFLNDNEQLNNVKFIDFNYFFKFETGVIEPIALYKIVNEFNLRPNNAKIILKNIKHLAFENKVISKNGETLLKIKDFLIKKDLISYPKFNPLLWSDKVLILDLPWDLTKEEQIILDKYGKYFSEVKINNRRKLNTSFIFNEYQTLEAEVFNAINSAIKKVEEGFDINNIKFANIDEGYHSQLHKIAKLHNFPVVIPNKHSLYEYPIIKELLANFNTNFKNNSEVLINEELLEIEDEFQQELCRKFFRVVEKYINEPYDVKIIDTIKFELKNKKAPNKLMTNAVQVVDLEETLITKADFVFFLNANDGVFPRKVKNNGFILDDELAKLGFATSTERNQINKQKAINLLNLTDQMYISYKLDDGDKKYTQSSLIINDDIKCKINQVAIDFRTCYSETFDLLKAIENNKIHHFGSYNNKFKYFSNPEKLTIPPLSYSSTNDYFKCQYKFYLKKVLKINKGENDPKNAIIGDIAHVFLENVVKIDQENAAKETFHNWTDNELNKEFDKAYLEVKKNLLNKSNYEINETAKFTLYKEKLREIMLDFYQVLKKQNSDSKYEVLEVEKQLSAKCDNVELTGTIDKILSYGEDLLLIDYKTGSTKDLIDLDYIEDGINLQLLFYVYLISNAKEYENNQIRGIYLQNVYPKIQKSDPKCDYDSILWNNYRYDGYTFKSMDIIDDITKAPDYKLLKGQIYKAGGGFTVAFEKKLFDEHVIKYWNAVIGQKIAEIIASYNEVSFEINPKEMKKINISCQYCEYNEICFKTSADIVALKDRKGDKSERN